MEVKKKATVGSVAIEVKDGKYRIRLPRTLAEGSKRYISTKLAATPENLRKVQRKVFEIEEDVEHKAFDVTLEKYSFTTKPLLTLAVNVPPAIELKELWNSYCQFMKPQLAATTYQKQYASRYTNHIANLPTQDITQVTAIRDHVLKTCSPYTAKRVIARISSCCKWGVKNGMLKENPFRDMVEDIKLTREQADKIEPDPFTLEERDAILEAFAAHPVFSYYYPFIRFLFLTGCRTGEAIALQWKHINADCSLITFSESMDSYLKIRKCTKTGTIRKFPCNAALKELLLSLKPQEYKGDEYVFTTTQGNPINNTNFTTRVWRGYVTKSGKRYKGLIPQLVDEGKVDHYRCLYNTRHTFITMALEGGMTVPQVAKIVGNSPEVIMRHYAGNTLKFEVPVI